MKIISLEMSAFGSYADTVKLDMTRLGTNGLYLITGDTGSGKTMIFDAILFALYGKLSGNYRNKKMMISRCPEANKTTYVELVFSYHKNEYKIYRSIRLGKDGSLKEQAKFSCNGVLNPATTPKTINAEIESIIKLTKDQFEQVVMIAQGEFRKLLSASTKDREEILQTLFRTEKYQKLQDELFRTYTEKDKQCTAIREQMDALIQQIAFPESVKTLSYTEISPILEKLIQDTEKERSLLGEQIQQLDSRLETIQKRLTICQNYENYQQDLQKAQKQADEQETLQKTQFAEYQNAKARLSEIDSLKTRKEQLVQLQDSFQKYQKQLELVQNLSKEQEKLQQDVNFSAEQIAHIQEQLQKLEQEQVSLADAEKNCISLSAEKEKFSTRQKQFRQLQENLQQCEKVSSQIQQLKKQSENFERVSSSLEQEISSLPDGEAMKTEASRKKEKISEFFARDKEYQNRKITHQKLSQELQKAIRQYNFAHHEYETAYANFIQNQAGILSQELHNNSPCPVCGSLHHPNPASLSESSVTSQQLDELNKKQNSARNIREEKTSATKNLYSLIQESEKLLQEIASGLLDSVPETIPQIRQAVQLLNQKIEHTLAIAEKTIQQKSSLNEQLQQAQKQKTELHANLQKMEGSFEQLQTSSKNLHEQLLSSVAFEDSSRSCEMELSDIQQNLAQLDQKLKENFARKNQFNQNQQQIEILSTKQKAFNKQHAETEEQLNNKKSVFFSEQGKQNSLKESLISSLMKTFSECTPEKAESLLQNEQSVSIFLNRFNIPQRIQNTENQIDEIQQNFSFQESRMNEIKKINDQLAGNIQQLQRNIQQVLQQYPNLNKQDELSAEQQAKTERTSLLEKKEKYHTALQQYRSNQKQFLELLAEFQESNHFLQMLYPLYETATGKKSKNHIKLETYIQMGYFDRILKRANHRLSMMTNGQYGLERKKDTLGSGTGQTGLDLNIVNYWNGTWNHVGSISGGEAFKAALSLALGLSEEIQTNAGGVQLDSMFLDEGFGSLDNSSLHQVMRSLSELSSNDRIIGIISHVEDLRTSIAKQIVVTKDRNGKSHAVIQE